ncbi:MAG: hypothetical protein ABIP78_07970 [Pyrinomonadaceae bacterium]
MKSKTLRVCFVILAIFVTALNAVAQKTKMVIKPPRQIIFAVVSDGRLLEPIAYINKGRLEPPVNGSDETNLVKAFNKKYYKAGATYPLIFGGAIVGGVTVSKADAGSECSKNVATVVTKTNKTPLKGLVMGLATNAGVKSVVSTRRKPTAAERVEMDTLVKAEFLKEKLSGKELHYQNLTALDVDEDGNVEFVGSYWVEIDKLTRGLLFFIAGKGSNGKYSVGYRDYHAVDQASVMSGVIKDVDDGVYHELLLDVFDYDGDGTSEIFTYVQSFEGAGFNSYQRSGNTWVKNYDWANYHCAY